MKQTSPLPTANQQLMTLKIIWGAMLASICIYGFVLNSKIQGFQADAETEIEPFQQSAIFIPLMAVAVVVFFLSLFLPKFLYKQANASGEQKNPLASEKERLSPPGDLTKYFSPFVIRFAMTEAVGIFGFVLGHLTHHMEPFFILGALSVLGFSMCFPTLANIQKIFD